MKKSTLLAVFLIFILPFASPYGLPDEALGGKIVYLEIGKPLIWEKGEIYNLEIQEIKGQHAYFNFIAGEKSTKFLLSEKQSIGLDLDGDSGPEMKVILEEIKPNGVNVKIDSDEVSEEKNSKGKEIFFMVLIAVLVLLIIIVIFYAIRQIIWNIQIEQS